MRLLYFDCFSGAAGDMILGALIDAGVPLEDVRRALGGLAVEPDAVWTERVLRAGIAATRFSVRGEERSPDVDLEHAHAHAHAQRRAHRHDAQHASQAARGPGIGRDPAAAVPHRSLAEIDALIGRSGLTPAARDRARALFTTLAEAEAAIHDMPLDQVHLHEVGALDSVVDVVGTVYALEQLRLDRIVASPLNVGGGVVQTAHGRYPVPAPATMRLLRRAPIYAGPEKVELVTPTGALLVTGYAAEFGPMPAMTVDRVGYGAGARDFPAAPNVLRVVIGDADDRQSTSEVVAIEAEIDDMNPQLFGVVMERLLAGGALDVYYTPIQMKKNRPGTLVTVLVAPDRREPLTATLFRETTTLGVRYRTMAREVLERRTVEVDTALGTVRIKVAARHGERLNAAPEFDDCVRLAAAHDVPVKHVQALAMQAYLEGRTRGL